MKSIMRKARGSLVLFLLGMSLAGSVHAEDIKDGRAIVIAAKDDHYKIDSFTFGKAELFGYMSELKETRQITGIVLKNGRLSESIATDEQRKSVASIGTALQLETFTQVDGEIAPLAAQ